MKHFRISFTIIASAFALAVLSGSCSHSNKEQREEGPATVDVANPMIDSITLYHTYPGEVYSPSSAVVMAHADGELLRQCYTDGAHVRKGQLLFVIDSSKYRDIVKQAEAALTTAQSQYEYARHQYEALTKALSSNAVSQMDVIQAKSSMEEAAASIKSCRAQLSTARINLGYCEVRAPISGIATAAIPNHGDYINGGASPYELCTIYDETKLSVKFNVESSEYERNLTSNGGITNPMFRNVPISFSQELPHKYAIDITYESPMIDPSTGTLSVRGRTTNPYGELKEGMFCTVHLPYDTDRSALLIRDASIGTDQLGKYVYLVNDSDQVVYTHIETGDLYRDSLRVVTKGLTPKSRYVTRAMINVRNGEKVKPCLVKQ